MIVDKVWKLTNTVRVGLDARSSHTQRQSTFPDNVCSYCIYLFALWRGCQRQKGQDYSDDVGGKSLSDTSTSARGKCVGENSTGGKSGVIRSSVNIFEVSRRDKPQFFVDVVKDKRTSACLCPISTQKHQGGHGG